MLQRKITEKLTLINANKIIKGIESLFFEKRAMMKLRCYVAVALSMTAMSSAFASEAGEVIFRDNGCHACHDVAKKSAGPSIKEIVTKYAGDQHAQVWLEKKVRRGGSGSFGTTSMPPIIEPVTDNEIKVMVGWILSRKPDALIAYD